MIFLEFFPALCKDLFECDHLFLLKFSEIFGNKLVLRDFCDFQLTYDILTIPLLGLHFYFRHRHKLAKKRVLLVVNNPCFWVFDGFNVLVFLHDLFALFSLVGAPCHIFESHDSNTVHVLMCTNCEVDVLDLELLLDLLVLFGYLSAIKSIPRDFRFGSVSRSRA